MDLTEISRNMALTDLSIANARIIRLGCRIAEESVELEELRSALQLQVAQLSGREDAPTVSDKSERLGLPGEFGSKIYALSRKLRIGSLFRLSARKSIIWNVDEICGQVISLSTPARRTIHRAEFRRLTISGWAVARNFEGPFLTIAVSLKGALGTLVEQTATKVREDVAKHFGSPKVRLCGFCVEFPMSKVAPGLYTVEVMGVTESNLRVSVDTVELDVK